MANSHKVAPRVSKAGSDKFPQRGPHNPNVGTSGSGMAPRPTGGAPIPGNDRPSHGSMHGLARVKNRPSSATGQGQSAGSFTPVQNSAMANLANRQIGQQEVAPRGPANRVSPMTQTPVTGNHVATKKPRTRAALAFYGE